MASRGKEFVIRALFLLACIWACRVAWDLHKEIRGRQAASKAYPLYSDFYPALGLFVGFTLSQMLFRTVFSPVARAMIPKKARWSHNVWGLKVIRCCDAVYKCTYYTIITIWSLGLLRDEPWVPWVLGGRGDTRHCWTDNYPLQAVKPGLKYFYLTCVGFALSEAAMLLTETQKPDFWEMLLHHTCSCCLIAFSFILNYTRVGSLVLLAHGAVDIFIFGSKAVVDTSYHRLIALAYFGLIISYGWFRVYVFPVYIMRSSWVQSVEEAGLDKSLFGWGFLNFALCVLLLLHIYWFGLILKMGCVYRRTGVTRDLQSNLSSMDLDDKKKT